MILLKLSVRKKINSRFCRSVLKIAVSAKQEVTGAVAGNAGVFTGSV
jgi:hypothetical protein